MPCAPCSFCTLSPFRSLSFIHRRSFDLSSSRQLCELREDSVLSLPAKEGYVRICFLPVHHEARADIRVGVLDDDNQVVAVLCFHVAYNHSGNVPQREQRKATAAQSMHAYALFQPHDGLP